MEKALWKEKNCRIGFIFLLCVSYFFGIGKTLPALAQEGVFVIEPLYTDIEISEGDSEKKFVLSFTNHTKTDETLSVSVVDFGTLDESGGVVFLGGQGDFEKHYGLASWMRVGSEVYVVPAGETEHIPVVVENQESLSPGGHYGAVLFQLGKYSSGSTGNETPIALDPSLAALVFVKKTGGEVVRLEYKNIEKIELDSLGILQKAWVRFQNSGNTHVIPRGRVIVSDSFGRTVRKGIINEESSRVLPESFREYPTHLKSIIPAWLPGWYTMVVEWRYEGKEEMERVQEKRIFPVGINLLWLVGVFFLIFLVKKTLDYRKKRFLKS